MTNEMYPCINSSEVHFSNGCLVFGVQLMGRQPYGHLVNRPIDDQTTFDHYNTGHVCYLDPHCEHFITLAQYKKVKNANSASKKSYLDNNDLKSLYFMRRYLKYTFRIRAGSKGQNHVLQ